MALFVIKHNLKYLSRSTQRAQRAAHCMSFLSRSTQRAQRAARYMSFLSQKRKGREDCTCRWQRQDRKAIPLALRFSLKNAKVFCKQNFGWARTRHTNESLRIILWWHTDLHRLFGSRDHWDFNRRWRSEFYKDRNWYHIISFQCFAFSFGIFFILLSRHSSLFLGRKAKNLLETNPQINVKSLWEIRPCRFTQIFIFVLHDCRRLDRRRSWLTQIIAGAMCALDASLDH